MSTVRRPSERRFKAHSEKMFRKANPDARIRITWAFFSTSFFWPGSGEPGVTGHFIAEAPGYATRRIIATWSPTGWTVQ